MSSQKNFIEKIAPIVQSINKSRGYPLFSSVVIAQACLETGYGASQLMMKANAIFGIKAGLSWRGKVYSAKTKEVYNSKPVTITDTFRAYSSLEESINDYFNLICNNKRYSRAVHSNNFVECIHGIASGGYATDPSYADKVIQIINSFYLVTYDSTESIKEPAETQSFLYSIGKTYELQVNLNVRYSAGLEYGIKKYSELTPDGKRHSTNKIFATLKKGTRVTCQAITFKDGNTWMKIPSGYVCAIYNNKIYVK